MTRQELIDGLAARVHSDRMLEAGQLVLEFAGQPTKACQTEEQAQKLVGSIFFWCLNNDRYDWAAKIAWDHNLFHLETHFTRLIWSEVKKSKQLMLMGSASTSKSYAMGVWLLLDWVRDPLYTNVALVGPSEDHLRDNLFSHLVTLHQQSSIPLPGITGDLFIGLDPKLRNGCIRGVVIPLGKRPAGRLQGRKRKPRKGPPHPQFGTMSRMRIFLDEFEKIPSGVWKDIDNIVSNLTEDPEDFKIIGAFNPEDPFGQVAIRCEPVSGWEAFDPESDETWVSKRGWRVARLDAKKCENVVAKKVLYPGLQSYEGYCAIIENAGGTDSPGYWCVDEKTEVLSRGGWRNYKDLGVSDLIYTVNPYTGLAEWQPVQEVFSKHFSGDLTELKNRSFSALVTDNHRWAVTYKNRPRLEFRETKDLQRDDTIPLCRPAAQLGHRHDPVFAEILGWLLGDGTLPKRGDGARLAIYQSEKANPKKCERIRELLRGRAGLSEKRRGDMVHFRFSGKLAKNLRKILKEEKLLTMDVIEEFDRESLDALWRGLRDSDGGFSGGSNDYVSTSIEDQAGMFAALAARLGVPTTTHRREIPESVFPNGRVAPAKVMWYVQARLSRNTRKQNLTATPRAYSGDVWCPRTANGTFYARRNGTTYFTGNTMARACFPRTGAVFNVIPSLLLSRFKGEFLFIDDPIPVGGVDVALEGNDTAEFAAGRFGLAAGIKWRPTFEHPKGRVEYFVDEADRKRSRYGVQLDQIFALVPGDTIRMGDQIKEAAQRLHISPGFLMIDRTGNGAGVHDYLRASWSEEVRGVNFSESATETRILEEDVKKPVEVYKYLVSEVWFALKKFMEFDLLKTLETREEDELMKQLGGRRYAAGKFTQVEGKPDYKSRGNRSPNKADALTLFLHCVRVASGRIFSGLRTKSDTITDASSSGAVPVRVDHSNRYEDLDLDAGH